MKPVVFLAHSLGGIVLKQALLTLADRSIAHGSVFELIRGGILFGVPHRGMAQEPLLALVKGQPNEELVKDLAKDSHYLASLDDRFTGVLMARRIVFNFAYETKTSPTVEVCSSFATKAALIIRRVSATELGYYHSTPVNCLLTGTQRLKNGSISRAGPPQILVDRPSATRGAYGTSQDIIFSINNDHSSMVKFPRGSSICENVLNRLDRICNPPEPLAFHDPATSTGVGGSRNIPSPKKTHTQKAERRHEAREWTLEGM